MEYKNRAIAETKKDEARLQREARITNFIRTSSQTPRGSSPGRDSRDMSGHDAPLLGGSPQAVAGSSPLGAASLHSLSPLADLKGLPRDIAAVSSILLSSWLNVLLVFVPLGFAAPFLGWGAVPTFFLAGLFLGFLGCLDQNFVSLIPLALILGDITEDLAVRFGPAIGGLINATFGNIVEILLSIAALNKHLYDVVAYTLLGSILSNLLLVLGSCMFFGGLFYKTQTFNEVGNRACSSLLFLSAIGVMIPTAASSMLPELDEQERSEMIIDVSRAGAVILLLLYGCYLTFQLKTHKELFEDDDDDEEDPRMSITAAIIFIASVSVVVAIASEFLTGSIAEVSDTLNLSKAFLGMVVLPIAGNACEHLTAVVVATKNKMDLSFGVAIGSSIQISLLALPLNVVVAWALGLPFGLDLDPFSALALTFSVLHASIVTSDGQTHWLQGAQLMAVYAILAIAYFYR